jgi:PAS domain S-box-containing protein
MKVPSSITEASGSQQSHFERKQTREAEKLLATQYAIAQILAGADTLHAAGAGIMRSVCENLGWEIGALWIVDEQAAVLRCSYFWHVPSIDVGKFEEVTHNQTLKRRSGLPGRVWERGEPSWITDISKDAGFVRMPTAVKDGIRGAFGFPILLKSEVLGVMEFFSREVRTPDAVLMEAMAAIGNHIGQFIERKRTEANLRASEAELRALFTAMSDLILVIDAEGRYLKIVPTNSALLYQPHEQLIGKTLHDVFTQTEADFFLSHVRHALAERRTVSIEYSLIMGGEEVWFAGSISPMHDDSVVIVARDVTESKRAGKAVRKGEEYINLFKLANDAILIFEPEGEIVLDINDKACQIYGFSREDFIGLSIKDISQNVSRGEQHIKKLLAEGTYQEFETVQFRADGTPLNLLINASVIQYQGRQAVLSINRDITSRKLAEQALRESEERFRMFSEATSEAIVIHDRERILEFNNTAALLCGYDPAEVSGMSLFSFAAPESHETIRKNILAGYEHTYEVVALRKDGSTFPVEIIGKTFNYKGQKARLTRFHDITQRKLAEAAVHEADHRAITEYERLLDRIASLAQTLGTARDLTTIFRALREFVNTSTECCGFFISLYDAEHHTQNAVYAWSEGEEEDLSRLPPMPMNESPHSRAVSTGQIIITDDLKMAMGNPLLAHIELERDSCFPQSSLVVPMVVMGRIIGVVEAQSTELAAFKQEHATAMRMAANLTAVAIENVRLFEREQEREAQLRQSHKMEAVGQLAGGVAHDFNNIVAVIMLQSELLLTQPDQSENSRRRIEEIRRASHRAAALTQQLLAFSRKQVLQPKVLDLNAIVSDMDRMLRRLIGEHIEFVTVAEAGLGQVKADRNQIEQVVMNLAINARDAMPAGGKLYIRTADVELDENYVAHHIGVEPGRYVMLAVSDTGTGMDAQTQARIFEPFFTTKAQGKGTGLGLSTVYGIVKQSGGNIWVYSEQDLGTTFKVYLPRLDRVVERGMTGELRAVLPQGTETILLVEDEEMIRKAAREILEANGYLVLEASGGAEALMICRTHKAPIQLLMTDVVMPQMNGRELAEHLAALRPELKVLYMSGYTDDAIVHHGVLDAGIAFLEKPFTAKALTHRVRELLDAH